MTTHSIIIAEDHEIVRESLKLLIENNQDWYVIGQASNGKELLGLFELFIPDLVVVDLAMPTMQGYEAISEIHRCYPEIKTVVLSGNLNEKSIAKALHAGADGFVSKADKPEELITAIEKVLRGGFYMGPALMEEYGDIFVEIFSSGKKKNQLTRRETQIITLLAEGLTSKEIGDRVQVSSRTIDKHRSNIMEKLNLRNVVEMVRYAFQMGFIS